MKLIMIIIAALLAATSAQAQTGSRQIVPGDVGIQVPFGAVGNLLVAGPGTSQIQDSASTTSILAPVRLNVLPAVQTGSIPSKSLFNFNSQVVETYTPTGGSPNGYIGNNFVSSMNPGGTGTRTSLFVGQNATGADQTQYMTGAQLTAHGKTSGSGKFTASNPSVQIDSGLDNTVWAVGQEINTVVNTAVTVKQGLRVVDNSGGTGVGSLYNDGIALLTGLGSSGYTFAIHFANDNGIDQLPVGATGTFIYSDAGTVATGIDFTHSTFNTAAFKSPGFTIDGTGNATALSFISPIFKTTGTNLAIQGTSASATTINFDFPSSVGANTNTVRFFRSSTQSTGSSVQILKGDGTNTVQTNLSGFADSFIQALTGKLTVGSGSAGAGTFNVVGTMTVSSTITNAGMATGTPVASVCLDASNNIIKKTTTGPCI